MRKATDVRTAMLESGRGQYFCIVPFSSVIFLQDGTVGICRDRGLYHSIGNLTTRSIQEIWNGPEVRKWRREIISGTMGACAETLGRRPCNLKACAEVDFPTLDVSEVQLSPPAHVVMALDGRCNLRCNMCNTWKLPNGFYDDPHMWQQVISLAKTAKYIDLVSGEPFLADVTYRLIDQIGPLNPSCGWRINTNANWELTSRMTDCLDKIVLETVEVSLDSLDSATYREIRQGGDLALALSAVEQLEEYRSSRERRGLGSFTIVLYPTIQRMNWEEIPKLFAFSAKKNFPLELNFLIEPKSLSVFEWDENKRSEMIEFFLRESSHEFLLHLRSLLPSLINSFDGIQKADFWLRYQSALSGVVKQISTEEKPAC